MLARYQCTAVSFRSNLATALGLLLTVSCGADKITVCTLLGCTGGLTVHLTSLPSVPFSVELTVPGYDGVLYSYDCTAGSRCSQDVVFPGLTADHVHVTVRVGGASRSTDVTPSYTSVRPNGPNCPPECLSATVSAIPPS